MALVLCVQLLYCKVMITFIRALFLGSSILLAISFVTPLSAQQFKEVAQDNPQIRIEQLANGLGVPWGMVFLTPNRLLVTERAGSVKLLDIGSNTPVNVSGVPRVVAAGQGGLLDVAIGPNYREKGWIYFTYSKPVGGDAATTLARARLKQSSLVDWQDLPITDSATDAGRHFGSRITFDDQGHIFFGVGDRADRDQAQDLSNHIGTIIRLNLDGSVPADNPFVGIANARDEIWSYGHRNPQGLIFDPVSKRLWSIEHGPRGGDEVNLILKGRNYGWPVISHGKEYWGPVSVGEGTSKEGMEQPSKVYIPSIAPGSLIIYRGEAFPRWNGNLFAGALKLQHLERIVIADPGVVTLSEPLLEDLRERIRALIVDSDGRILFSTDSGRILRISPGQ